MKKIYLFLAFVVSSVVFTACSDFLDITPNDMITGDNFYQSEEDFQAATAPLYNKVWFNFNDKFYYALGDGRGFNLYAPYSDYIYPFTDLLETGLTSPLVQAWGSLYNVIQQSNKVIQGIANSTVDESIKEPYIAEARFMRGVAYWYLASLWGNVIISTNPDDLVNNPIVNTAPTADVYMFAIRDLEYAAKYLPETAVDQGRVTSYSAYAMLSRVYLGYAGLSNDPNSGVRNQDYLTMAKEAALKVIQEGPYKLLENYADLFQIANNNNSESIFAFQWVPNGDYGVTNTQQAYFACGSEITGDDAAWGYWTRAQPNMIWEYEQGDSVRRKATWMGYGDYYAEIQKSTGGYTYEKTDEALNVKKYVCGSTSDNADISRMNCPVNTYMMRYAEVLLNYAEAVLGNNASTTDPTALEYLNMVRTRAGIDSVTSISYETIRHERRVELCMEGQYWYDLVRRAYYKQQEVLNYIENQNRGTNIPVLWDHATQTLSEDDSRTESTRSIGNIDASIFILPYPESEVISNPLLKEDPVAYEFTEDRIVLF